MNCLKRIRALLPLACLIVLTGKVSAQHQKSVSGNVQDGSTKMPIAGVSVQATGTKTGSLTDTKGFFAFQVPDSVTSITVSYVGFEVIQR